MLRVLDELYERSHRQVAFTMEPVGEHATPFAVGPRGRVVYLTAVDKARAESWVAQGFGEAMKTPDSTLIYVTAEKTREIRTTRVASFRR